MAFRHRVGRPGHPAFSLGTRFEEAPHAPRLQRWCSSVSQNHHPSQLAAQTAFHTHCLGKAGGQYEPPVAPFARGRCPVSPLFRSYFPGAAARGSPSVQFSYLGPRSPLTAFVLDISIKFWSLNTAVGVVLFDECRTLVVVLWLVD
jgi:hypothetical protein